MELARRSDRGGAVLCLARDLEATGLEHAPDAGPEAGVVIDDQDGSPHAGIVVQNVTISHTGSRTGQAASRTP
jgi:hypothetical protein